MIMILNKKSKRSLFVGSYETVAAVSGPSAVINYVVSILFESPSDASQDCAEFNCSTNARHNLNFTISGTTVDHNFI